MRYIVIILVVVLVILLGLLLFGGNKKPENSNKAVTSKVTVASKKISDYNSSNSFVRLTIDGPVNADQIHRMIRITIAQDQNNLDTYRGYQYAPINSAIYANNTNAYKDFLFALQNGGFGIDRKTNQPNDAGMCPLGSRYIFEVFDSNKQVSRRWSSTCGNLGSFGGKTSLMLSLFKAQIPDYTKQITGINL